MKRNSCPLILLLFLSLASGIYPTYSVSVEALLIGYGGERMLPFIDGATLTYFVGESLELKSIGSSTNVTLIDPLGVSHEYLIKEGVKLKIVTFGTGDAGTWLLKHPRLGTIYLKVIDKYSLRDHYILIQKLNDNKLRLSLMGPAFIAFISNNESKAKLINPSEILPITIPEGTTYVKITLEYNETIELTGSIGSIMYKYKTDAIVSEYINRFDRPINTPIVVNFEIPDIGKVGKDGIVPLRLGPIKLKVICTGPSLTTLNYVDELLVIPRGINLRSIIRTIDVELANTFNESIRIAYFNASTSKIDLTNFRIPVYSIAIHDKTLSRNIDNYNLSVNGMISFRTGNITHLVPEKLQIFDDLNKTSFIVNPRLIIYSIDMSNLIKNITLTKNQITTVVIESKDVKVTVRHADGTLINNAVILVNSTTLLIINGSAEIRMPIATYNFTALTNVGDTSSIIDISKTNDVQLIIRTLLPTTIALILVSIFQGAFLLHYIFKLLRLRKSLKIN